MSGLLQALSLDESSVRVISVVGGGGKTSLIWRLAEEFSALKKRVIVTTTTHMAMDDHHPFVKWDSEKWNSDRKDIKEQIVSQMEHYGYVLVSEIDTKRQKLSGLCFSREISGNSENERPYKELSTLCDIMLVEADGAKNLPIKAPGNTEPQILSFSDTVIGVLGLDALNMPIREAAFRWEKLASFFDISGEGHVLMSYMTKLARETTFLRKGVEERNYRVFFNKTDSLPAEEAASLLSELSTEMYRHDINGGMGSLRNNRFHSFREFPSIGIVFLAAGNSVRYGRNKLLEPIDEIPMWKRCVSEYKLAMKDLEDKDLVQHISCVLVTQYPEIAEECRRMNIPVRINSHPEEGIASSLNIGLTACLETTYTLFAVCDQPWLSSNTIQQFLEKFLLSHKGLGSLSFQGEPGNPCIFYRDYYPDLQKLQGDRGGKRVLLAHPEDLWLMDVDDDKELTDVDVPTN
ncbi:MAG: selenium cofactor biosynthesis protein YqeC [Eubacteriales bacterium]|nr:selenium cofactor biosynthesis protein YqeC [Eubacteriales bacterium]